MKFDDTVNAILEGVADVKVKKGRMKTLLGLEPDEKIIDKFSSGKELASKLLKALNGDKKEAAGMLAFAANVSPAKNLLDDALNALKDL